MSADTFVNVGQVESFDFDNENTANLEGQLSGAQDDVRKRLSDDYNELDEPILDTLARDLMGIYSKMKIIALPLSSYDTYKVVLRGWDLWGPLMLCTFMAFELHRPDSGHGPEFSDVFVLVWFGSCIVSLNYRLLSASSVNSQSISFQSSSGPTVDTVSRASGSGDIMAPGGQTTIREEQSSSSMQTRGDEEVHRTLLSPPSIFQLVCVFGYCLVAPCFGLLVLKIISFQRLFFERILIGLLFGFAWPTMCSIRILVRYQHPSKRALAIYPIGLYYFMLSCMIISSH